LSGRANTPHSTEVLIAVARHGLAGSSARAAAGAHSAASANATKMTGRKDNILELRIEPWCQSMPAPLRLQIMLGQNAIFRLMHTDATAIIDRNRKVC
jgi:hypothetical protein